MAQIVINRWSKKHLVTAIFVGLLLLIVKEPGRSKFACALVGCIIGNQVGVLLDGLSKKWRVMGILILLWNAFNFFTGRMAISASKTMNLVSFLWGYGFLSAIPQEQLSIVKMKIIKHQRKKKRYWKLLYMSSFAL